MTSDQLQTEIDRLRAELRLTQNELEFEARSVDRQCALLARVPTAQRRLAECLLSAAGAAFTAIAFL